ncbi:hypothetical protein ACFL46_02860 [Candidatus Neomarinimicrobiota bacterium]
MRLIVKIILLTVLGFSIHTIAFTQDIPIESNNPVHNFIYRQVVLGHLPQWYTSLRPLTVRQVNEALNILSKLEAGLNPTDLKILERFTLEFHLTSSPQRLRGPWQKAHWKDSFSTSFLKFPWNAEEPHIISYRDSVVGIWADWSETHHGDWLDDRGFLRLTDHARFYGEVGERVSFYSDFTMNRFVGDSSFVPQIEGYQNEDRPYDEDVGWTLWYNSRASVVYDGKYFDWQISKIPLSWGYSPNHSPILSLEAPPFPYISLNFNYRDLRIKLIHGTLFANPAMRSHQLGGDPEKYLAAHRFEYDVNNNLTLGFSEMIIYGRRPMELDYLVPVNILWPTQHNLGDHDNYLLALDCSWRLRPGLTLYQTLFMDELAWVELFKDWWGNKYVYQAGLHVVFDSKINLPDLRVEIAIARPWTYTHDDSVNTYSSAGIGLGLPQGPNSQSILVESSWWPTARWYINGSYLWLKKGLVMGSSATDNYDLRDRDKDYATPFLLGTTTTSSKIALETHYALSGMFDLVGWLSYESETSKTYGRIGLIWDW